MKYTCIFCGKEHTSTTDRIEVNSASILPDRILFKGNNICGNNDNKEKPCQGIWFAMLPKDFIN